MALIKCSECGKEVSSLASTCPQCGAPIASSVAPSSSTEITNKPPQQEPGLKIVQGIVGLAILVIAVIYFFPKNDVLPEEFRSTTTNSDSSTKKTSLPEENRVQKTNPQPAIAKVTAKNLYDAYTKNEVATDQQLAGYLIEISGRVASIDKDFKDSAVINLSQPNALWEVELTMKDSEKPRAAKIVKGQSVTIRCESVKRIIDTPAGDDCVFVE